MPLPLAEPLTETLRDFGKPRINRAPSPALAIALPWLLVMFGSIAPAILFVTSAPLVPPMGFILLVAWQQLRPGLFPVWAGLPLGLFDDLYSGQPFGSAVLLWSATMIALDLVEARFPWRGVELNWLAASGLIPLYILLAAQLADLGGGNSSLVQLIPQILLAVLAYPIAARLVGAFDRLRLIPIRKF